MQQWQRSLQTCKRHSPWAGAPSRPPPASAPRWGPGARASPAPDMGRSTEPSLRLRLARRLSGSMHQGLGGVGCWELNASGEDWKKKKCFERRAHHPCGTFPPPLLPFPKPHPGEVLIWNPGGKLLPSKLTAVSPSRQKGGTQGGGAGREIWFGSSSGRGSDPSSSRQEHRHLPRHPPNTLKALSSSSSSSSASES